MPSADAVDQRHLDEDQRLVGQPRMEEAVAAAVAVQPVLHVGPARDVVHRLVLDQLLDQRGRRVPADAAQVEEGDVEPGGEQVLELGVQRQQALVALQVRQQFGAQVDQEAHAVRDRRRSAAAAARAATPARGAGAPRPAPSSGVPMRGLVAGRARALTFCGSGAKRSLISSQTSRRSSSVAPGVPLRDRMGAAAGLDLAHARVDDRLQFGQRAAQRARRQRLAVAAQRGLQALGQRARAGAWLAAAASLRVGLLGFGGIAARAQARDAAGDPVAGIHEISFAFCWSATVAQRFALAGEVGAHGGLGAVAVARLQRGEHRQVLRQALVEPARRMQLLQARELEDLAQVADHLRQPAVVGQHDDGLVDREVGRVVLVDALGAGVASRACRAALPAPRRSASLALRAASQAQRPSSSAITGKMSSRSRCGHLGHEAAAPRLVAQQPFGRQHLERLAQRRARDLQPLAQRRLVDEAARRQRRRRRSRSRSVAATSSCRELWTRRMGGDR